MQNVNWAGVNTVGEESSYIHQWQSILQDLLPRIRDALTDAYFRSSSPTTSPLPPFRLRTLLPILFTHIYYRCPFYNTLHNDVDNPLLI
jgi:hypothetical protein